MTRVRVNRKGESTIPQQIRKQLGIEKGAILEVTSEDNKIIFKPLPREPIGKEEPS